MTSSNTTAAGDANMTQPLVPPKQSRFLAVIAQKHKSRLLVSRHKNTKVS